MPTKRSTVYMIEKPWQSSPQAWWWIVKHCGLAVVVLALGLFLYVNSHADARTKCPSPSPTSSPSTSSPAIQPSQSGL